MPGELQGVTNVLKVAAGMSRQDFLKDRKQRMYPEISHSASAAQLRTTIDIESKDFIRRDESEGVLHKFNIN